MQPFSRSLPYVYVRQKMLRRLFFVGNAKTPSVERTEQKSGQTLAAFRYGGVK